MKLFRYLSILVVKNSKKNLAIFHKISKIISLLVKLDNLFASNMKIILIFLYEYVSRILRWNLKLSTNLSFQIINWKLFQ